MRISKWVDFGQEVEVDISVGDVRGALAEAFANVTEDRLGEERPTMHDVTRALNQIATFFNALTDEQVALLNDAQRETVGKFLSEQAERFAAKTAKCAGEGGDESA